MLGLGYDRALRRSAEPGGLCLAGADTARARHHGGLRPAQIGKPASARQGAPGFGCAREPLMPCWSQHRTRPILFGYAAAAVAAGRSLMLQRLFIPPPRTNPQLDYLSIDYVFMLGAFAIVFSG